MGVCVMRMKPLLSPLNTQKSFIIEQELTIGFLIVHTRNNFVCVYVYLKVRKGKHVRGEEYLTFSLPPRASFFLFVIF